MSPTMRIPTLSLLLLAIAALAPAVLPAQGVGRICRALHSEGLEHLAYDRAASHRLSRRQAAALRDTLTAAWRAGIARQTARDWADRDIRIDSLHLRFDRRVYGTAPADGRSLYISMHGGGNTATAVNDQQWENQKHLYKPAEGVYVAPRAPWDNWNMWFQPGIDALFERLIAAAIVRDSVNPDKVYLLGYSAGGDGVWRMAPRMADRWAAAAMMAGHPGEAEQVNLLHVPFMIWMGELDAAYDRNRLAAAKGRVMDSLQRACPEGYVHETHIITGKGHWMERQDTAAIAWMARYRRDPLPAHIVWRQEDVCRTAFYWLKVRPRDARHGMRVEVRLHPERGEVEILSSDYRRLTVCLNDDLLDLDRPVSITHQGRVLFKGRLRRTAATMARSLLELNDPRRCFTAEVEVEM